MKSTMNIHWRIDAEDEALILWPPDAKTQVIGKHPDSGKDWGQEKKRATEDEMVGRHHWLHGHEFEQTPGDSEEQGSLACCSPLGRKESDNDWATEQQQNTIWFKNINLEEKSTKSPRD